MAFGAARALAEENRLAGSRIARHRSAFGFSLKDAKIFNESFYRRRVEAAERRHAVRRNSVGDDLRQRGVGAILSFGRRGDVGSALAAPAVEAVTAGAAIFERLTSFRDRPLILRWVILRRGCTFDGEGERASDDSDETIANRSKAVRPNANDL